MEMMRKMQNAGKRLLPVLWLVGACVLPTAAQDVVPTPDGGDRTAMVAQAVTDSMSADVQTADSLADDSLGTVPGLCWQERLRRQLDGVAREAAGAAFTAGVCVYDLTGDSLLFGYNQHKVMRPASVQKLLTAVTALDLLGRDAPFVTRAFCDGTIVQETVKTAIPSEESAHSVSDSMALPAVGSVEEVRNVLHGNIVVAGGFDPLFSTSDLKALARAVKALGIDEIDGRLVGDVSMKDTLQLGNGWCWDDVPSSSVPYLSPLLFNHGRRVDGGTKGVPHPERYLMETLADDLRDMGIRLPASSVRITSRPDAGRRGREIFYRQHTLGQVMERMMKNSDNLHAEAVFVRLAALGRAAGATWKDGARQVESVVRRAGGETAALEVADGSGLSLYNYVTPETLVALLRYAYFDGRIFTTLYESLPVAGMDGTLSSRMRSGAAYRNVRAKTGTLEGVSTLAGYVQASNGNMLAFSILVNGALKNATAHHFQDRICQILAR